MKTFLAFLVTFLSVVPSFADDTPKLNLLVHKTIAAPQMSGWLFEIRNNDDHPVPVSDLEIRFWVYEPNRRLVGLRFKEGEWKNLKGVVNGEAVMCAFLSPPFETVASRKADYAIRYRSAEETMIPPGKSWKNIRIGFGAPIGGLNEQCYYSQKPMSQGKIGEPWFLNGMFDDPHFCLYYRGTLVKEWESASKPDPNTGVEPDPYQTTKNKIVREPIQQQIQQTALNPAYSRMPQLSDPIRIGDDTRYIAVGGDMINVGKAKQEIQKYAQEHPGQSQFARVPTGNPNIHQANLPSSPSAPTGGGSFTYDENGNTLTDPSGKTYEYDALNELIHVTASGLDVSYIYDGDGLRVSKINNLTGVRTNFLWDRNNLTGVPQVVEELQNGQVVRTYVYGPKQYGIVYQHQLVNGVWVTNYYGKDATGSVRFLMDETGNVTDRYDYDAFGIILNRTGSTPNNMLYAGEYFDDDTGLVYLRSRWYAPDIGRFYTMDSEEGNREDPLSLHKYVYVENNPTNRNDPTGHDSNTVGSAETRLLRGLNLPGQPSYVFLGENQIQGVINAAPNNFVAQGIASNVVHTFLVKTFDPDFNGDGPGDYIEAEPANDKSGNLVLERTEHPFNYPRQLPSAQRISQQPLYFNADSLWMRIQNEAGRYRQDSVAYDPWAWTGFNSNSFTGTVVRNIGLPTRPTRNAWGWGKQVW